MNYLAHTLLAGDSPSDRVGGLIGDFVKGPLPGDLPPALARGVALHRAIDSFADRHPAFIASRARVSARRRRVGGILVDLFYDHLLARDWTAFASGSLAAYCAGVYGDLQAQGADLPAAAREAGARMRRGDWLNSYREVEAIGRAIDRMALHRLRRPLPLAGGIEEFLADTDGFAADFQAFLPDAQAFAADWRRRTAALPAETPPPVPATR